MQKFKILVLTDHSNHRKENSLYGLVQALRYHPRCLQLDIATRGNELNAIFFKKQLSKGLHVTKVDESFVFYPDGRAYKKNLRRESFQGYDAIWLRLPPPLSQSFLSFLKEAFPKKLIINDPAGIYETGSKKFLTNFQDLCPPMQVCESIKAIETFKNRFPIVLKPYREYGGKGIIRIDGEQVWNGKEQTSFKVFAQKLEGTEIEYLGVKFLKNVSQGDKRIVVVNGEVMGASLRLPAKGSWLCNVAQGGSAHLTEPDEDELKIIERINSVLLEKGIVMYGVDTLMGDDGRRVLSEINTTSIGGLAPMETYFGKPVLKEAAKLIWQYIIEKA